MPSSEAVVNLAQLRVAAERVGSSSRKVHEHAEVALRRFMETGHLPRTKDLDGLPSAFANLERDMAALRLLFIDLKLNDREIR